MPRMSYFLTMNVSDTNLVRSFLRKLSRLVFSHQSACFRGRPGPRFSPGAFIACSTGFDRRSSRGVNRSGRNKTNGSSSCQTVPACRRTRAPFIFAVVQVVFATTCPIMSSLLVGSCRAGARSDVTAHTSDRAIRCDRLQPTVITGSAGGGSRDRSRNRIRDERSRTIRADRSDDRWSCRTGAG